MAQNPQQDNQGDMYAQYQQFWDWIQSLPAIGPYKMAKLGAQLPILGLYNTTQEQLLRQQQIQMGMKQLENDLVLGKMDRRLAYLNLKFQQGPYFEYLQQKTANDTQISNNEVLTSGEYTRQAQEGTKQARQATLQSRNNTLASLQNTEQARYGAEGAKYQYMNTKQRLANPIASGSIY